MREFYAALDTIEEYTSKKDTENYAKYIKGEHLKVDRDLKLFTDKSADSTA